MLNFVQFVFLENTDVLRIAETEIAAEATGLQYLAAKILVDEVRFRHEGTGEGKIGDVRGVQLFFQRGELAVATRLDDGAAQFAGKRRGGIVIVG